MPAGNSYPAPQLPLNGAEQLTLFQQQGAIVATCTVTIAQIQNFGLTAGLASPPPIGSSTPNSGAFTELTITEFLSASVSAGLTSTGTTQTTALVLQSQLNVLASVGVNTGAILPIVSAGTIVNVLNRGANVGSIYPPVGHMIETLGVNSPSGLSPGGGNGYCYVGSGQWFVK
jgi:hypothetical protein